MQKKFSQLVMVCVATVAHAANPASEVLEEHLQTRFESEVQRRLRRMFRHESEVLNLNEPIVRLRERADDGITRSPPPLPRAPLYSHAMLDEVRAQAARRREARVTNGSTQHEGVRNRNEERDDDIRRRPPVPAPPLPRMPTATRFFMSREARQAAGLCRDSRVANVSTQHPQDTSSRMTTGA